MISIRKYHIIYLVKKKTPKFFETDLDFEIAKYDQVAEKEEAFFLNFGYLQNELDGLAPQHRPPYLEYYKAIELLASEKSVVLELGAGTGRHSLAVTRSQAKYYALDVSRKSLEILAKRTNGYANLLIGNMTEIPLQNNSIDLIVMNGCWSYAKFEDWSAEIRRVLRPGGSVILLDSLNHNIIFRTNRFYRYLSGHRTKNSLKNMPRLSRIWKLTNNFANHKFKSFGTLLFIYQPIRLITGSKKAIKIIYDFDRLFPNNRFAFKFLLVLENHIKQN